MAGGMPSSRRHSWATAGAKSGLTAIARSMNRRSAERRDTPRDFARYPESLATCGQYLHAWATLQQRLDELSGGVDEVLAGGRPGY
jgi:hypothetical protein